VERIIADTGFRPLASAQSLVSQRTGVIGFVVPIGTSELFEDPYFAVLIRGLSSATSQRSLTLALFLFDEESSQNSLIDQVVGPRRVDGLIVSAFHTRDSLIDRLAEFDVPVVTMGPNTYPDIFGSVAVDNFEGGAIAGRLAGAMNRAPIAIIGGPENTASGTERRQGFIAGLAEHGLRLEDAMTLEGDFSRRSGEDLMRQLLPLTPRTVFIASDTMAAGALSVLESHKMRVPQDISIIGFDDLPSASVAGLTTVRQPIVEVADAALEILLNQIDTLGNTEHRILPVELIIRESAVPE
jgi:DNA-binding LacI/PurR family transcriptional regulator